MKKLFNIFVAIGFSVTFIELVLKINHSNLCNSEGCRLAANSLIIPDEFIIALGALVFLLLLVLSLLKKDVLVDSLLAIVLSAEGVFVSYQIFRFRHICHFCISVFLIFLILAIIRLFMKKWVVAIGFCSFFAILGLFSVLKPYYEPTYIISSPMVLIYKPNCPHCEKVEEFLKKKDIKIKKINALSCLNVLKTLGINAVPILVVRNKYSTMLVVGDRRIIDFLSDKVGSFSGKGEHTSPFLTQQSPFFSDEIENELHKNRGFCSINSSHCQ